MAKEQYLIFTSPANKSMVTEPGGDVFNGLSDLFGEKITRKNTVVITTKYLPETSLHIFLNGEYVGWCAVVSESEYKNGTRDKH